MAGTTGRILLQQYSHRVQRQSFASKTPKGSSGQKLAPSGTLESESGAKLNTDGFPRTSMGSYMESLFSKWLRDNSSIHSTWNRFFKDFVKDNAAPGSAEVTSSTKSDLNVKPRQEETLPPQPMLGSVLPAEESANKVPEQMAPEKPEEAAKGDQKPPLSHRRGIPKFFLFQKLAKLRRQAASMRENEKCLQRAKRIPGTKCGRTWRNKGYNAMHFKSYYEEKLNKKKAKGKENELIEMPQEKPQPSRPGAEVTDPNQRLKTYDNLVALLQNLEKFTVTKSSSDPNNQERPKNIKPWKDVATRHSTMPSDIKSFVSLPRALIEHSEKRSKSEDKVLMSGDKAKEPLPSDPATEAPKPKDLTEKPQPPLGDGIDKKSQTDAAPPQRSSDP